MCCTSIRAWAANKAGDKLPKKYKHLKPKKHVFRVASVDAACNLDPTPSTFKWKVLR